MAQQQSYFPSCLPVALALCAVLSLGCGSAVQSVVQSGSASAAPSGSQAGSITVSADSTPVAAGTTTQLHAIDTNATNQTTDVTATAVWTSSNPGVATVSAAGLLTGKSMGTATISAALNNDRGSMSATVGSAALSALQLSPGNSAVYTHGTLQYTATASYTDNTTGNASSNVQWTVSPANSASMSATGLLSAIAAGNFTVTATMGTQSAVAGGTVSDAPLTAITVSPANANLTGGATQQFTAMGAYADLSTADLSKSVRWTSSDSTRLTIDANGLGTAHGNGTPETVTVTAQWESLNAAVPARITSGATLLALIVLPTSSSIVVGSAEPHTALAMYSDGTQQDVTAVVNWSVVPVAAASARAAAELAGQDSGTSAVTVDQGGTDTAVTPGMTVVQASLGTMQAQSAVIVTTAKVELLSIHASRDLLPMGSTVPVRLIGQFPDGSSQDLSLTANWQSSDPSVATIDSAGVATAFKAGDVQFSASFGGLTATTTDFEVVPAILVSTVIRAPQTASASGERQQLSLIGTYSDGTTHDVTGLATWQSSNSSVSSVDTRGAVYSMAAGTAQVMGMVEGRSATVNLTVAGSALLSITILAESATFAQGSTLNFTAIGSFTGGATSDLTAAVLWSSLDPTVLTINTAGVAKSGGVGSTQVTASLLGVTGTSAPVRVTVAPLANGLEGGAAK